MAIRGTRGNFTDNLSYTAYNVYDTETGTTTASWSPVRRPLSNPLPICNVCGRPVISLSREGSRSYIIDLRIEIEGYTDRYNICDRCEPLLLYAIVKIAKDHNQTIIAGPGPLKLNMVNALSIDTKKEISKWISNYRKE